MTSCWRRLRAYLAGEPAATRTATLNKFDALAYEYDDDAFEYAASAAKDLKSLPTSARLRIYGLYKQATVGDAPESEPASSVLDPASTYKWRAWAALRGMAVAAAKDQYVYTVRRAAEGEFDEAEEDDEMLEDLDEAMGSMGGPRGVSSMTTSAEEEAELVQTDRKLPLHAAARQGDSKQCEALLASGACSVDARDEDDHTALHWAADSGSMECTRALIGKGASVHSQNCDGSTPLHMACACEHEAVARLLLQHGASREVEDIDGCTPLSLGLAKELAA